MRFKQVHRFNKKRRTPERRLPGTTVAVENGNVDKAIRKLKKKLQKEDFFNDKFKNMIIPRPKYWVGIKIVPSKFEFWEEKEFRLHKRELFSLKYLCERANDWSTKKYDKKIFHD